MASAEAIEIMAKAAYEQRSQHYGGFIHTWEETSEYRKRLYRDEMKAALAALNETKPE